VISEAALAAICSALLSTGVWQGLSALLKRKPEERHMDAETESLRIQTADRLIVQLDLRWEKSEQRNRELVGELAQRDAKVAELEGLVRQMRAAIGHLEEQLALAERQLASLRDDQARHHQEESPHA
jgi:septal ring factor EnvC (AmiA/AmiB activator)